MPAATEISRKIPAEEAFGEFIGVMRLTARGVERFLAAFDAARDKFADADAFWEGRTFRKAYLIDLLQQMVLAGEELHCVGMHGGYMEIDTTQDAELADRWWSD